MRKSFRNGKIIVRGKYHEDVVYDVGANDLRVRFDGKGGITNYTVSNQGGNCVGQGAMLCGVLVLHKAGLRDLKNEI